MSVKISTITIEYSYMLIWPLSSYTVISKTLVNMEIKNKYEVSLLKNDKLVLFVGKRYILVILVQPGILGLCCMHCYIEFPQIMVSKTYVVTKSPLAPTVPIREVVSFSGKIHPFGMSKLVTHEVKVRLAA